MLLLHAYSVGVFPMADGWDGPINWFQPDPRGVLPLDALHVPRSLARAVRGRRFESRFDHDVAEVIRRCAGDRVAIRRADRESEAHADAAIDRGSVPDDAIESGCWMNEALLSAYLELVEIGHAHSVEAWRDGVLVGGLYGVRLGSAFFGESMFCRPDLGGRDASKVCLVHLVRRLVDGGFTLLDTQMVTDHMRRFGAIEISDIEYQQRLAEAVDRSATWPG